MSIQGTLNSLAIQRLPVVSKLISITKGQTRDNFIATTLRSFSNTQPCYDEKDEVLKKCFEENLYQGMLRSGDRYDVETTVGLKTNQGFLRVCFEFYDFVDSKVCVAQINSARTGGHSKKHGRVIMTVDEYNDLLATDGVYHNDDTLFAERAFGLFDIKICGRDGDDFNG